MKNKLIINFYKNSEQNKNINILGKNTLIYGFGSLLNRIINLIIIIISTRYLTPDQYGVLAMLALFTMLVQPIFTMGLDVVMGPIYFEIDTSFNKSKAVWSVFIILLISVSFLLVFSFINNNLLSKIINLPIIYESLIIYSLIGSSLLILATPFVQRIQFENNAKTYIYVTFTSLVINIIVSIYSLIYLNLGILAIIFGQISGNALHFILFFLFGIKGIKPIIDFKMMNNLIRRGILLIPSFFSLFIILHSNKYILEYLLGLHSVGLYTIGLNFGMAISVLTGGFVSAWYTFFMGYINCQQDAQKLFPLIFIFYSFLTGLFCIFFFLYAKPIIFILTDEQFHESYKIIGLIAFGNFLQIYFNLFLPGLYYNKDTRFISLIMVVTALVSLPITYFFILYYGIYGAAIGFVIGNLIMPSLTYLWIFLNRDKYIKIIYEWNRVFYFFCISIIILYLNSIISVQSLIEELIKSIFFSVIAIMTVIIQFKKNEKQLLVKLIM